MSHSWPVRTASWVLALTVAVQLGVRLERTVPWQDEHHSMYLPSGEYLRYASLGFRAMTADLLYIWSIQYYSVLRSDRWRNLARMYDTITDLDPQFNTAYLIGALILSVEAGRYEEAIALLDKGSSANPRSYIFAMEAAMYSRDLREWERATKYFEVAKRRPDAPRHVARWHAYMTAESGHTDDAIRLWTEAAEQAQTSWERLAAERHVKDLTMRLQLDLLRRRIGRFRAREGRYPYSLEELVRTGYLKAPLLDPVGREYIYDRKAGEVSAATTFLREHSLRERERR